MTSDEALTPISYPGFMNMVHKLWGGDMDPSPLADQPVAGISVSEDKEQLVFTLADGRTLTYTAEGDCCSHSWIEHLTVPPDIAGSVITGWKQQDMGETEADYETIKVYQTSFITAKGEIVVEYRNSSNGYYGGWLSGPVESVR
jgi:hypothetical protein